MTGEPGPDYPQPPTTGDLDPLGETPRPMDSSVDRHFTQGLEPGTDEAEAWKPPVPSPASQFVLTPHNVEAPLLGGLLRAGVRVIVGGPTGAGKSTLCGHMVAHALDQRNFCGYNGGPPDLKAAMIDLEMSPGQVKLLLERTGLARHSDRLSVISDPEGWQLVPSDRPLARKQTEYLSQLMYDHDVVMIDPYYKLFRESGGSMDRVLTEEILLLLDNMAREYSTCLLIPAHARKLDARRPMTIDDIYGPSILTRNAAVVLGVQVVTWGKTRLHFFKDRYGELPVQSITMLSYRKEGGYSVDGGQQADDKDQYVIAALDNVVVPLTYSNLESVTGLSRQVIKKSLDRLRMSAYWELIEEVRGRSEAFRLVKRKSQPKGSDSQGTLL